MSKDIVLTVDYLCDRCGEAADPSQHACRNSALHPYVYVSVFDLDVMSQPLLIDQCDIDEFETRIEKLKYLIDECVRQVRERLSKCQPQDDNLGSDRANIRLQ